MGGWCGRKENKVILAFNSVKFEIKVEPELGNDGNNSHYIFSGHPPPDGER